MISKKYFNKFFFCFSIFLLLFLVSCGNDDECKKDVDCFKKGFVGSCVDGKCYFSPLPEVCGNGICDADENKCSCPEDCGVCGGFIPGSNYLQQSCVYGECIPDVPVSLLKQIPLSKEIRTQGDTFSIDILYNQPFNLKKDLFKIDILLKSKGINNKNQFVKSIEISGKTFDKRNIFLARKEINKNLWSVKSKIKEEIRLGFPTNSLDGEISSLEIKINYDYTIKSFGKENDKEGFFKVYLTGLKFIYVNPSVNYPCPESCDDGNPATQDYCSKDTDFFCVHDPMPNKCGNFVCDASESKCSCPEDCGPCSGDIGNFLELNCKDNLCVAELADGVKIEKTTIIDERNMGVVKLINTYDFNFPFDINKDKFVFDFSLYSVPDDISEIKIETIRLLQTNEELAKIEVNKKIPQNDLVVDFKMKKFIDYEEEIPVTLKVWYSYKQKTKEIKGSFTKSFGRITFINPK